MTRELEALADTDPLQKIRSSGIQPADPGARRRAAILVLVLAAAGGLAVWWMQARVAALHVLAEQDPANAVDELARLVGYLAFAISGPLVAFSAYGYWIAYRVYADQRFPPVGMAVVRDTPIIEGQAARRRARLLAALTTALLVASVALPVTLVRAVAVLRETIATRGVMGGGGEIALPPRRPS